MDPPPLRKKHLAKDKLKEKGPIVYSQRHVRIELDKLWRTATKDSRK